MGFIGIRFSDEAQQRIIQRAEELTGLKYEVQNAIRVLCGEPPSFRGAPFGERNGRSKSTQKAKNKKKANHSQSA